ncbi:MAG: hypothetical protein A2X82_19270 [Geobacteraceae bacterium GWC2_55_20]|nr:MAG: hypothetical protein A2X82_19270 [Geobacteraceae bacterium GWC2_55_20]OGU26580.1 MAG: hypothetical protein A2X85_07400 [Geobacteraceae bacterium GWF2_54_21]HBA71803.1 hypothetical protein [Geobacter sp.]HCE66181.1 hypothetical protein [Geobacter sp.]
MKILPSDGSYKTFCDLITAYRLAETVKQAVRLGIIETVGDQGCAGAEIIAAAGMREPEGERFLALLLNVGILEKYADNYCLSLFSRRYLLCSSESGQLHVLEFEPLLIDKWSTLDAILLQGQGSSVPDDQPQAAYRQRLGLFQKAMHEAAVIRAKELWDALPAMPETGVIIDIGAGDGTYLREFTGRYPRWQAVACDLEDVLAEVAEPGITTHACNLLDQAELDRLTAIYADSASIVLMSNLLHCYSPVENEMLLGKVAGILRQDGLLIVHDFFRDGNAFGAIYDAHMMLNTYNGRAYSFVEAIRMLNVAGLPHTGVIELQSYSHAILAEKQPSKTVATDPLFTLRQKALSLGFFQAVAVVPQEISIEAWVDAKCRYGCMFYNRKWSCPPHSMGADGFRELLRCYSKAMIVAGQPPLRQFQHSLLELEKHTFLQGFKKALVFTGGPCSWCENCADERCSFPEKRRPSLESCGCDVFALAQACGIPLKPIENSDDFVQYIGLLLVD